MSLYVRVKICGITNIDDALASVECGADALGFVFFRKSPRFIEPSKASDIARRLPPFVSTVGVFVNESHGRIEEIIREVGLSEIQLHGDEPPSFCGGFSARVIKAVRVSDLKDIEILKEYDVGAYLLDTYVKDSYGGTGRIFDWDIALEAKRYGRLILAGGLDPDNVGEAIRYVRPYAVDVSSGIEREPGRKDHRQIARFIEAVRAIK